MNKETKTSCRNCFGMGTVERGSAGPVNCVPCKGNGHIVTIERVDHFEPVRIETKKIKK